MFFESSQVSQSDKITDTKSARIVLNKIVKKEFEKMRDEMIKVLVELNIPEEDYEYIDDLYQKVRAQAIILFNQTLKEKINEVKNQSDALNNKSDINISKRDNV